ncbi:conserved membrane hypothetical protein [[Clostridium] ultunense Esp]|uniref:DUF2975 domain-containing protein n=1 Tax=[Clostridium] ultunense Esp TaxID=1288971 RepID=M1ZI33_9FIRM|nr:DUF2975 domain-containing protein [Schnuerera ultunensis]CCQ98053.1 conserved membrane hypothetical protein [[Clostridium] ultunense Esp]SHD76085.1 conserved membrane protein of unknown function [[Clostridium] ultunense Esp]
MKNKKNITKVLKISIDISFWLMLVLILLLSAESYKGSNEAESVLVFYTILRLILGGAVLYVLYSLKKIILTIEDKKPFDCKNIKRFNNIAKSIFLFGLIQSISKLPSQKGFLLIGIPNFNIHADILIYIILGCLALVLGQVFKLAIEIKDENDLTI